MELKPVSIPFIAGQWSLPWLLRQAGLKCKRLVSIPFIAGQWSLRNVDNFGGSQGDSFQSPSLRGSGRFVLITAVALVAGSAFQSPSLRGSGRFQSAPARKPQRAPRFQSPSLRGSGRFGQTPTPPHGGGGRRFQSPSLRGSGRFWVRFLEVRGICYVSIPFIAGQWSLRSLSTAAGAGLEPCFNPLHCGAVVASYGPPAGDGDDQIVSIPFIAGQWSLRHGADYYIVGDAEFQSPSLRGSGRFRTRYGSIFWRYAFQSPSLRGSGRFLIAAATAAVWRAWFQSPSLRGSGRFPWRFSSPPRSPCGFQSPSLRGSGRFMRQAEMEQRMDDLVSIPFIAGQWSLPNGAGRGRGVRRVSIPFIAGQWSLHDQAGGRMGRQPFRFNPLHCGAVVASLWRWITLSEAEHVSIPFIAGQWSLLGDVATDT